MERVFNESSKYINEEAKRIAKNIEELQKGNKSRQEFKNLPN